MISDIGREGPSLQNAAQTGESFHLWQSLYPCHSVSSSIQQGQSSYPLVKGIFFFLNWLVFVFLLKEKQRVTYNNSSLQICGSWWQRLKKKKTDDISQLREFSFTFFCCLLVVEKKKLLKAGLFAFKFEKSN